MDLGDLLQKAISAARRGDVALLETELGRLAALPPESIRGIDVRLRAIARAARTHPSYTEVSAKAS